MYLVSLQERLEKGLKAIIANHPTLGINAATMSVKFVVDKLGTYFTSLFNHLIE